MPPTRRPCCHLQLARRSLPLGRRTLLMGILNVTPDSFSEQGRYFDRKAAIARGLEMEREGADLLDIGGESTRPGAAPVPEEEELDRTLPVIETLRRKGLQIPISIDTYKSAVARRALRAGAEIVNDISGLRFDPALAQVVSQHAAGIILMHIRGTPQTMQQLPVVRDVVGAVRTGLARSLRRALAAGIGGRQIVLDPGIGFGKTAEQNLELIRKLPRIARLGYPLLLGPSRKSFLRKIVEELHGPDARGNFGSAEVMEQIVFGTAAAVVAGILNGAHMVRVHDVRQMLPVARLADRLME
ncbi:MAG TPA: dihydropteroate synthase [Terriglobia bacterium]|nr:dihydropteroate synthase [Terriglobia bacterium]